MKHGARIQNTSLRLQTRKIYESSAATSRILSAFPSPVITALFDLHPSSRESPSLLYLTLRTPPSVSIPYGVCGAHCNLQLLLQRRPEILLQFRAVLFSCPVFRSPIYNPSAPRFSANGLPVPFTVTTVPLQRQTHCRRRLLS